MRETKKMGKQLFWQVLLSKFREQKYRKTRFDVQFCVLDSVFVLVVISWDDCTKQAYFEEKWRKTLKTLLFRLFFAKLWIKTQSKDYESLLIHHIVYLFLKNQLTSGSEGPTKAFEKFSEDG